VIDDPSSVNGSTFDETSDHVFSALSLSLSLNGVYFVGIFVRWNATSFNVQRNLY
jgi:hypothetical protein